MLKMVASFFLFVVLILGVSLFNFGYGQGSWQTADRSSAKIAPKPEEEKRAMVQLYAARTFGWRKAFAVHTWIATKEKNADAYKVYHVIGWRVRRGESAVWVAKDIPDRKWYGNDPEVLSDIRGELAEKIIPQIAKLAESYPYKKVYRAYPGPNSNSFIAYIIRHIPELEVELPPHAIGKDWINEGDFFAKTESGTGVQVSVFGMLGASLGLAEGVEVNLLGMSFGLDLWRPALKLPFLGRIGFPDAPIFHQNSKDLKVSPEKTK